MKSIVFINNCLAIWILVTSFAYESQAVATSITGNIKSLDIYADGQSIHLLTSEVSRDEAETKLWYTHSSNGCKTWSDRVRVDEHCPMPYARGRGTDFHLAAVGGRIVAVWMTKGTGFMGRGPLVSAYSEDGGKTWHPGTNPADDGTDGDHSFIDVAADINGNFHVIWLDKRTGNTKGLYAAKSTDGGKSWAKNIVVDSATCDCCWNVLTRDSRGNLYAFYRDLKPRDMALAVSNSGGTSWKPSGFVGEFDWNFEGCPHVGGGLVATDHVNGTILHAAVWTGKEKHMGLYYLQSLATQQGWTSPKQLGSEFAKFPDIAANIEGSLAVVWDDYVNDELAIFSSTSTNNGKTWSDPTMLSAKGVQATHPRIVSVKKNFHVFWTETKNGKVVWNNSIL